MRGKKKVKKRGFLRRLVKKKKVKMAKTSKERVRKKVKKISKRAPKEERVEIGFEEVVIKCPSCGREFRIVKSEGFSAEGMLCQRCAAGGGVGFEEEGDF